MKEKIEKMKKEILPITKALAGHTFFVAGGFIRDFLTGEQYHDIDIYFKSRGNAQSAEDRLVSLGGVSNPGNFFSMVRFEGFEIQIIKERNFQKPSEMNFDFRCCQACLGFNSEGQAGFWSDPNFYQDAATKTLVVNNITGAMGTVERLARFSKRGYSIDFKEIIKIVQKVNGATKESLKSEWYALHNRDRAAK